MLRLFLVIATVATITACGSPSPPASVAPPVSHFENDVLSFEYPSNWNALVPTHDSDPDVMVYLSTEQIAQATPRIQQLNDDGVYIAWTLNNTPPTTTPDPSFTSEVEIGGRPAVVTQAIADGECAALGGGELLTVRIDSPTGQDDVVLLACVRGPNVELTGATIAGMLASVEWKE